MSTIPIHKGQWIDWSRGQVLGSYWTFDVQETLYIVGAVGVCLTMVGGSVWSMWAFVAHQLLSSNQHLDMVDLQHRNTYRNTSTPTSAVVDAFWIYWWWKPWVLCGSEPNSLKKSWSKRIFPCHTRKKRASRVGQRTCVVMLPALIVFAAFALAGVFGSHIATPAYRSNTILVRDGYDDGKCGITLFDTTIEANVDFDIDASSRTRAAVSYAETCYSPASGVVDSIACSLFVVPRLGYSTAEVGCPFGNSGTPFNQTVCASNSNMAAFALQTDRLNSHEHFGINAPSKERIEMYKEMVCSPLVVDGFTRVAASHGVEASGNMSVTEYLYGSVQSIGDFTFSYNSAAIYDNVPFGVTALMHNTTGPAVWMPVSNISRSDADVTIVFIAPNSIKYRDQVKDPVFQATYTLTELSNVGQRFTVYTPDYPVAAIACTEQYSICNPQQKNGCTPLDGQRALLDNIKHIGLNSPQYVTAIRMIYMIADGNTYSSIDGIGPDALQIWNGVHDFVAPTIHDNQWQLEVQGWLNTTLAKWQAYMVSYAYNTAALGLHGHVGFPVSENDLEKYWRRQCQNQKINNVGLYQNVSIFGFSLILAVGGILIILSLSLKQIVKQCRTCRGRMQNEDSKARRLAWNIDGKLQGQRLALQTSGYYDLVGGGDDVPYLDQAGHLPLPFHATEEPRHGKAEPDTAWSKRVEQVEEVQPASQSDTKEVADISQAQNRPAKPLAIIQSVSTDHSPGTQNSPVSSATTDDNVVDSMPLPDTFHPQAAYSQARQTD